MKPVVKRVSIYSERCCALAQDAYIKTWTRFFQKVTGYGHSKGDWNFEYEEAQVKKKKSVFKNGEKDLPRVYDPSPKYCVVMLGAPAAPSGDPNMLVQQLGSWLSFRMSLAIVCWCRAEGRALEQAWSTASLMLVMGALGFCCLFFVFTFWFFV